MNLRWHTSNWYVVSPLCSLKHLIPWSSGASFWLTIKCWHYVPIASLEHYVPMSSLVSQKFISLICSLKQGQRTSVSHFAGLTMTPVSFLFRMYRSEQGRGQWSSYTWHFWEFSFYDVCIMWNQKIQQLRLKWGNTLENIFVTITAPVKQISVTSLQRYTIHTMICSLSASSLTNALSHILHCNASGWCLFTMCRFSSDCNKKRCLMSALDETAWIQHS